MLKHYVEFLYPGFVPESCYEEITERDPNKIIFPKGSYGFRFVDREEIELREETLKGAYKNQSGWYYRGRKMSLEDVKREKPEETILINNMTYNNQKYIVWTNFGQAFPLEENDVVI